MTRRRRWTLAGLMTAAAVAWVPLNNLDKRVEGPKLLVLSQNHAVTTADLLSVALVLGAVAVVRGS
ncbi:hypothetical protein [Actinomycetospora straminea]|nr:hypothetical protein [Actinomycetospora straminea]MDD7931007.1 hypothetical protein [Actinomycetospora straminea]